MFVSDKGTTNGVSVVYKTLLSLVLNGDLLVFENIGG